MNSISYNQFSYTSDDLSQVKPDEFSGVFNAFKNLDLDEEFNTIKCYGVSNEDCIFENDTDLSQGHLTIRCEDGACENITILIDMIKVNNEHVHLNIECDGQDSCKGMEVIREWYKKPTDDDGEGIILAARHNEEPSYLKCSGKACENITFKHMGTSVTPPKVDRVECNDSCKAATFRGQLDNVNCLNNACESMKVRKFNKIPLLPGFPSIPGMNKKVQAIQCFSKSCNEIDSDINDEVESLFCSPELDENNDYTSCKEVGTQLQVDHSGYVCGVNECEGQIFSDDKPVKCKGQGACQEATFEGTGIYGCGLSSCLDIQLVNEAKVTCKTSSCRSTNKISADECDSGSGKITGCLKCVKDDDDVCDFTCTAHGNSEKSCTNKTNKNKTTDDSDDSTEGTYNLGRKSTGSGVHQASTVYFTVATGVTIVMSAFM